MRLRTWSITQSLGAFLIVGTMSATSFAQVSDAEHKAAVASFQQGTTLVEAGNLRDAIVQFQDSLKHEPSGLGARLNLADCFEKEGAPDAAWREYAIAEYYARKGSDARRNLAQQAEFNLENRLLKLTIAAPLAEGLAVKLNDQPLPPELIGLRDLAVLPGRYKVEVDAKGKKPFVTEVSGSAGQGKTVNVVFEDAPNEVVAADEGVGSTQKAIAVTSGVVGIAGLALGIVEWRLALSAKQDSYAHQQDPTMNAFTSDRNKASSDAAISTVAVIAGGVLAAAGVVLYLVPLSSSKETTPAPAAAPAARLHLTPAIGKNSAGLMLGGAW
jgi:hypothetical protein